MSVPKGSNTGTTLRLKGKGMPVDGRRGDQYVRLEVVLPDKPDSELEQFVEKWKGRDYDVRGKQGLEK
jgi:DnaJ-class molecular chaperone